MIFGEELCLRVEQVQYLFASPDPNDVPQGHQGAAAMSINWKLNDDLVKLWKRVAEDDW